MKKPSTKQIIIIVVVIIISLVVGTVMGFLTKIWLDEEMQIKEKEKQTSIANLMSESEIRNLKATIEYDEESYGDNYAEFKSYNPYVYKENPDRIYFKSSKVGAFYVFENNDENYEHLLEVAEDRMHYSAIDDWNLNCFEPDSVSEMMTSGKNYIIFDYDDNNLYGNSGSDNRDIILSFSENTRLYRLVTYLCYFKEPILRENLPKREFAENTTMTGYQYMTYTMGG